MRDRTKRLGIQKAIRLAEQRILQQASGNLTQQRVSELRSAAGSTLFVAGRYPSSGWEEIAGFAPDNDFHYEVIVGVAVEPNEPPNLFAKALISRDSEEDVCIIHWEPADIGAQPSAPADRLRRPLS